MIGLKTSVALALCAGAMAVTGCTTHHMTDERTVSVVEYQRTDQTANRALQTANAAKVSADKASMDIQRALDMAQQARDEARAANEKADRGYQTSLRK